MLFQNRTEAGQRLAQYLRLYTKRTDTLVLALPRGGVPVAAEIAAAIQVPLDILVVRKLGVPGFEELAMGAIASGGAHYLNQEVIQRHNISEAAIAQVTHHEQVELNRREKTYRNGRPPLKIQDHVVILVDDGLATGATMQVAIKAIKQLHPRELIVAVPVAAPEVCNSLKPEVDYLICAETPQPFYAVGLWYREFEPTSDEAVKTLLRQAMHRTLEGSARDR
jgi:putative phosphoribosyl transferase